MKTLRLVENFIEFTSQDATSYAQVRAKLEEAGTLTYKLATNLTCLAVVSTILIRP